MPRILLVEDEQVNREMFRRRLVARGFDVLTAENGERAVELTTAERPELVLMDLGLPGIDGWEATRRLKANPDTAPIPVIALSAHATADAKEKAFAVGCVEFETKPVQMDRLVEKVQAALAARPPGTTAPPPPTAPPAAVPDEGPKTLVLPRPTGTMLAPGGEHPAVDPPDPAHESGTIGQKRILVVEDNDANRVMLCRRLAKQGFITVEARDGREALQLIPVYRFDLVLLDIMMPEVDGYQVLQTLKADPDLKALPVIMISAVDEMASVVRCIEMGAEDYLPKPYDPVLLQARINACLDKRRLRDQELAYFRAVADLTRAAEAVEKGDFDPQLLVPVAGRTDTLGTLARVFDKMAREVQAREQQLRQEVQRLQVEIDLSRKDAQVKEITEDGFFRELQQKAAGLRRRFRKDGQNPPPEKSGEDSRGPAASRPPSGTGDERPGVADTRIFPRPDLGLTPPPETT
ncbi:MAG: divK 3 [Gemmataceae bacterium]|nr:divK 3 [Gemmataceae bacterium]